MSSNTSGSFRHTSKYSATASKYGIGGAPVTAAKGSSGGGSKMWDGFKKGETEVDRKQQSAGAGGEPDGGGGRGGGEKDGLLEKDYIAEARHKSERFQACLTQVRRCKKKVFSDTKLTLGECFTCRGSRPLSLPSRSKASALTLPLSLTSPLYLFHSHRGSR
jgi:hypothetical protein